MHWKDWCWSWSSTTLATWCEELTHWKRPRCWERLKAGGEGDDREWDGWMASATQWTWVWENPGDGEGRGSLASFGLWGRRVNVTDQWQWPMSRWTSFHFSTVRRGHLACLYPLATKSNAAMNTGVQAFLKSLLSLLWGKYPEVRLQGHVVIVCLTFWDPSVLFSTAAALFCIPTNSAQGSFLHIPASVLFI